jgi:hypothetical protein
MQVGLPLFFLSLSEPRMESVLTMVPWLRFIITFVLGSVIMVAVVLLALSRYFILRRWGGEV